MCRLMIIVLLLTQVALLVLPSSGFAEDWAETMPSKVELQRKTLLLNVAVASGILVWGVANWDYFQTSPRASKEEWFGHGTDEGGADKIGHIYTTYIASRAFRQAYLSWGYEEEKAGRLGVLSALWAVTLMEVGDSFSGDFGFSYEDLLMNVVGAGFGYLMVVNPDLDRKLDLRAEYLPEFGSEFEFDFFTDYEHIKYVLAVKADGFDSVTNPWLKYLELHLGYYTRNYDDFKSDGSDRRKRVLYVGLGLNVGKLLERWVKVPVFDYLQVPYTYLPLERNFDH
ncbi:MAG: DUF2279 domain-containing protein [Deltaproteobacteria bacterium]|nr:DUF2279 domain-containing protein [Deltaproteobacteria bacterium]